MVVVVVVVMVVVCEGAFSTVCCVGSLSTMAGP